MNQWITFRRIEQPLRSNPAFLVFQSLTQIPQLPIPSFIGGILRPSPRRVRRGSRPGIWPTILRGEKIHEQDHTAFKLGSGARIKERAWELALAMVG